jgi:glutamate synthase (NADPH/NADH) large chain
VKTKQKWNPNNFKHFHLSEHDACGIIACIEKEKSPTKRNIDHCIDALISMNHRAGFVEGEGDGAGIHMDLPKELWYSKIAALENASFSPENDCLIIGHFFVHRQANQSSIETIKQILHEADIQVISIINDSTNPSTLGPSGKKEKLDFIQIAASVPLSVEEKLLDKKLLTVTLQLEKNPKIHVASLSQDFVVYKVMGSGETLRRYYYDLSSSLLKSTMTLGHNRFSTNTLSTFYRVQPFSLLGHNGEINTIAKLREEARHIGVDLPSQGSDSQDLNRIIETLIVDNSFSLFEAMELVFPPILNEINRYNDKTRKVYETMRQVWGHFAQGPAGIISRFKNEAVFSVDSLGLRPLWKVELENCILFSSEPGISTTSLMVSDPKPLGPGEKMGLTYENGKIKVYEYPLLQKEVAARLHAKWHINDSRESLLPFQKCVSNTSPDSLNPGQYNAFGWEREHIQFVEHMAAKGAEPIRSIGHDSPLAALIPKRKNVADFIKESVAVVTNPAIDRDRETEHFSTRILLGARPDIKEIEKSTFLLEIDSPLLVEGKAGSYLCDELHHPSYDQLFQSFHSKQLAYVLSITFTEDESIPEALERISAEALVAVNHGKSFLVLDDSRAHQNRNLWLDPHLALSTIHHALGEASVRRKTSVILRSASIRSLHDIMLAIGFGADAISPYYMFWTIEGETHEKSQFLFSALNKGIEKVISTIGIHELRGYNRLFSSIGIPDEVAKYLHIVNFFGSSSLSNNWLSMKDDAIERMNDYGDEEQRFNKSFSLFPRIWKSLGEVALSENYEPYREKISDFEVNQPLTARHLLDLKQQESSVAPESVNIQVGDHAFPFVISSMSFGSQNEVAFRAYAEAAEQLNMISMNGEGGEIKDMIGKYPRTRGQQIASGRFGVNAELLHSSYLLEIKIGQGAKPGEGGHLPGSKVTSKIAEARNATIGSDLISPSNNHDIYSIEDLAQMIYELKTINPNARVAVKVPVVPNIGTISVGIVKAGADIVSLSGFDGGTGAARIHALQHVGLPIEIGVKAAHNALLEAGLRHEVEIWADGGMKSAQDVVKVMLLGANRIGFGTLSMIAIGCTTCRGCHLDTCHVGIATQIDTEAQAKEHGLRRFVPREHDMAVEGLKRFFRAFGKEIQGLVAEMGELNLQNIVGRSDLLKQSRGTELLDLQNLLELSSIQTIFSSASTQRDGMTSLSLASGMESTTLLPRINTRIEFEQIYSDQRVLGGHFIHEQVINHKNKKDSVIPFHIHAKNGSIPGNGLGAYLIEGARFLIEGGAQDGTGKTSIGGEIVVLKAKGLNGNYINGSVGKGFGYGAQKGLLMVQGVADARAGIRLSGADLIVGGPLLHPIPENEEGNTTVHSSIKGFAFEYMTNGRGLVLGDPGPWICAGMTGGVIYLRKNPAMGLTKKAIMKRLAVGANVVIQTPDSTGIADLQELISLYISNLRDGDPEQDELSLLLKNPEEHFYQIIPKKEQADPAISTE